MKVKEAVELTVHSEAIASGRTQALPGQVLVTLDSGSQVVWDADDPRLADVKVKSDKTKAPSEPIVDEPAEDEAADQE